MLVDYIYNYLCSKIYALNLKFFNTIKYIKFIGEHSQVWMKN